MTSEWIGNTIAAAKDSPDASFADTGPALERLLKAGVNPLETFHSWLALKFTKLCLRSCICSMIPA